MIAENTEAGGDVQMKQILVVLGGAAVVQSFLGALMAIAQIAHQGFQWWKLGFAAGFLVLGLVSFLPLFRWRRTQPDWLGMATTSSVLTALLMSAMWRDRCGQDGYQMLRLMAWTTGFFGVLGYMGRPPECMLPRKVRKPICPVPD